MSITLYGRTVTALPTNIPARTLPQAHLNTILQTALAQKQNAGAYNTGVASGEFDDPDDPDDTNPSDCDNDDLIPEAFLESDVDAGGESAIGSDAVGVASGLTGQGGAGSSALNGQSQASTSVFCSPFACAAASQSDENVRTSVSGGITNASGPLIAIQGPLITIHVPKSKTENIDNYYSKREN